MIALVVGLLAGFFISIPPGPVGAFTIETTLSKGKRTGMSVGLGVALIDTVFCLGILFASSAVIGWLFALSSEHPTASMVIRFAIIIGIIAYALTQLFSTGQEQSHSRVHLEDRVQSSRPFIIGSATALSNAFNPTFLPSLTALIASVSAQVPQVHANNLDRWLFALGFGAGTFAWLYALISVVARHHAKISPATMVLIRRIGAVIFIVFALYLSWKMLS